MQLDKDTRSTAQEALRNNKFEPMVAAKFFGRTTVVSAEAFAAITNGDQGWEVVGLL